MGDRLFRDGPNAQDPIVTGSIPSLSTAVDYTRGFTDPRQRYPRIEGEATTENDQPKEARTKDEIYKEGFAYTTKQGFRDNTEGDKQSSIAKVKTSDGKEWKLSDLSEILGPVYPQNHVKQYERKATFITDDDGNLKFAEEPDGNAAHIVEYDTTPGFERISTMHRTGTYHEITPKGNQECVIQGYDYKVVVKDKNVYVQGNCNLTIDGNCNTLIEGDWDIQVNGNKNERIVGTLTQTVDKDVTETYKANQTLAVTGNLGETVSGSQTTNVTGNIDIDGARIDLN